MNITLTNFRTEMFKLVSKLKSDGNITITHKRRKYVLLPEERARKLMLEEALKTLPNVKTSLAKAKSVIEKGRP